MPVIKGQCHCGNLSCSLVVPDHIAHLTLYACACSFCRLHACTWLGNPADSLSFNAEDPAEVGWYATGALHPNYLLCRHCGVVIATVSNLGDGWYGIINAEAAVLPPLPQDLLPFRPEPLTDAQRLAMRRQRWVKHVQFGSGLNPPQLHQSLHRVG